MIGMIFKTSFYYQIMPHENFTNCKLSNRALIRGFIYICCEQNISLCLRLHN